MMFAIMIVHSDIPYTPYPGNLYACSVWRYAFAQSRPNSSRTKSKLVISSFLSLKEKKTICHGAFVKRFSLCYPPDSIAKLNPNFNLFFHLFERKIFTFCTDSEFPRHLLLVPWLTCRDERTLRAWARK